MTKLKDCTISDLLNMYNNSLMIEYTYNNRTLLVKRDPPMKLYDFPRPTWHDTFGTDNWEEIRQAIAEEMKAVSNLPFREITKRYHDTDLGSLEICYISALCRMDGIRLDYNFVPDEIRSIIPAELELEVPSVLLFEKRLLK